MFKGTVYEIQKSDMVQFTKALLKDLLVQE